MKTDINVHLRKIEKALKRGKPTSSLPLPLKLRMAEVVLRLMERHKKFGLLVILGWKKQWKRYADTPDSSQDLFSQRRINIMKIPPQIPQQRFGKKATRTGNIVNTVNFDGAILVDPRGNILHSGTMIEGLRPRATAHKLNSKPVGDLSSQFGFKRKVHMRHITAITSSYAFKDTSVFTVSEESNDFHIFEGGKIAYSTIKKEMK